MFRSGWDWIVVEGDAELARPDDPFDDLPTDGLPRLLREIYAAAVRGDPDDWRNLDEEMRNEHHTAVLVRPVRCYSGTP